MGPAGGDGGPGSADKRNGSDRTCRCHQAHVDCVGVAVQRLSQEAQAAYQHRREQERGAWRHGLLWRAGAVAAAGLGSWLLIGLAAGARLGWRMALVAAWAAGGADLVRRQRGGNRTSASARYGDGKLLCNAAPRGRSGRWR
jgi:hypothetical protein